MNTTLALAAMSLSALGGGLIARTVVRAVATDHARRAAERRRRDERRVRDYQELSDLVGVLCTPDRSVPPTLGIDHGRLVQLHADVSNWYRRKGPCLDDYSRFFLIELREGLGRWTQDNPPTTRLVWGGNGDWARLYLRKSALRICLHDEILRLHEHRAESRRSDYVAVAPGIRAKLERLLAIVERHWGPGGPDRRRLIDSIFPPNDDVPPHGTTLPESRP